MLCSCSTSLSGLWVLSVRVCAGHNPMKVSRPIQFSAVVTDGGEKRQGKVTFIASTAEFTPKNVQTRDERVKLVYRVKIGLDNADGLFKAGMPAEARF